LVEETFFGGEGEEKKKGLGEDKNKNEDKRKRVVNPPDTKRESKREKNRRNWGAKVRE